VSFRECLGIDGEEPPYTCDWCGKSEVQIVWSGNRHQYCSFKCFAAGSYRRITLISAIFILMTGIFLLVLASTSQGNPSDPLLPVFIVSLAILIGINAALAFTVFVGRSLRRGRQVSELSESHGERVSEP